MHVSRVNRNQQASEPWEHSKPPDSRGRHAADHQSVFPVSQNRGTLQPALSQLCKPFSHLFPKASPARPIADTNMLAQASVVERWNPGEAVRSDNIGARSEPRVKIQSRWRVAERTNYPQLQRRGIVAQKLPE